MAVFHDTITIASGATMPSLGALIGSRASSEVFENINGRGHASIFGSEFDQISTEFLQRYVRPMDQVNLDISRTINMVMNPDTIRLLTSMEDFQSIPLSMELPIVLFAPVRQGMMEGRIEGFGWDPTSLPEEDFYGRMIDNFTCEDVAAASDDEGFYDIEATMFSTDPDLTDDELYAIRKTREYILHNILEDTDRDPTAIDLPRG